VECLLLGFGWGCPTSTKAHSNFSVSKVCTSLISDSFLPPSMISWFPLTAAPCPHLVDGVS
jgi:hypothetical protein